MRLGYDAKENRERANYCRFNEAEAHAPRIPEKAKRGCWLPGIASMRPRRMRLGYALYPDHLVADVGRFNEAEAHAPRILGGSSEEEPPI